MASVEEEIKRSPHFADVINTHRAAMAEMLVAFVRPLVASGAMDMTTLMETLKGMELGTGRPSIDGERRHAVSAIRNAIQAWK